MGGGNTQCIFPFFLLCFNLRGGQRRDLEQVIQVFIDRRSRVLIVLSTLKVDSGYCHSQKEATATVCSACVSTLERFFCGDRVICQSGLLFEPSATF